MSDQSLQESETGPWTTIWFQPRRTIRRIVESDPFYAVLTLALLGGIGATLSNASAMNLADRLPFSSLLFFCFLVGPANGMLSLWIGTWLLHRLSAALGGAGSKAEIRTAIAWSWAPVVSMLPLWGVKAILFRDEIFTSDKARITAEPVLGALFAFTGLVDLVISVWSLAILLLVLSEVNRFAITRSAAVLSLSALLIGIPVMLLTLWLGGL